MRLLLSFLVICSWIVPAAARAGNDDTYFLGTTASLTGGAAVGRSADPSGIWYNPAGLGAVERQHLDLLMSVGALQLRQIRRGLLVRYLDVERGVDLDGSQLTVVSPSTAYVQRFGNLTVGAGLFVTGDEAIDTSGQTVWTRGNEEQILDANIESIKTRYHGGLAAGFRLAKAVRLGFGLFAVYESLKRDFDFGIAWRQPGLFYSEQLDGREDTDRYGVQASAGLQVDVLPELTVGLLVRSPTLLLYEAGDTEEVATSAVTGDLVANEIHELAFVPKGRQNAPVGMLEPARAVLGLAWNLRPLQISAEAEFAHALRSLPVRSAAGDDVYLVERRALWNLRAGALFRIDEGLHFGAGVFTDHSPFRGTPGLAQFAVDYYGLTAGFRHERVIHLDGRERADRLVFRTSVGIRYALGTGTTGQQLVDLRDPLNASRTQEEVDVDFHELHIQIGSGVHF